jgi:sec-independent protein translocase protein TatC
MEQLWVKVKLAIIISTFLGVPYIIFKIWSFLAPGLYYRKKVYIFIMTLASCVLFVTGMFFCLYIIVPPIFNLSVWQDSSSLALSVSTSQFVNITAVQMMSFGLMFQVPAAVFLLVKSGLVHIKTLSRQRGAILVGILLLSALLTPPDVISQILMASATYLLFEAGLFITRIFMKRYKRKKHTKIDDIPDYSNAKDLVPTLLEQVLHTNEPETGPEVFASKEKKKKRRKIRSIAR